MHFAKRYAPTDCESVFEIYGDAYEAKVRGVHV